MAEKTDKTHRLPIITAATIILVALILLVGYWDTLFPNETVDRAGQEGQEMWTEAPNYSYTLVSLCGERLLLGTFAVHVKDHEVVAFEGVSEAGASAETSLRLRDVPSISGLLSEYKQAVSEADEAELVVDALTGDPTSIDIDWDSNAIDDEACYLIRDYEPTVSG